MTIASNRLRKFFFALAIMLFVPGLSWAENNNGLVDDKAQNVKGNVDAYLNTINSQAGTDLAIVDITSSHGGIHTVQQGQWGSATYRTEVEKEAHEWALKEAGFSEEEIKKTYSVGTTDPRYEKYMELKEQKAISLSKEVQTAKAGNDARLEAYMQLSGCKDRVFATSCASKMDKLLNKSNPTAEEAALIDQIKAAGEKAEAKIAGNPYAGVSQITLTDNKGTLYEMTIRDGKPGEIVYGASEKAGSWKGCEALPSKLYRQRECFFCPLFKVIYEAADKMTVLSFDKLAASFAAIIALGLGIWIAFQTLTHVSSLTKQDAPKFLGNLIKQSFKFLIAFLLLQNHKVIFEYVINPLLISGLTFGKSLLFLPDEFSNITSTGTLQTAFYSSTLYGELEAFVGSVQRQIGFMQAIGTTLICIGSNMMIGIGGFDFASGFQMAIQGILLAGFGLLLSLAFAFYLIDAVVQLGVVGALMPFLIACWPFKLTSQYSSTGFKMLLNSFFVFVFTGLVISVNLNLVDAALGQSANGDQTIETQVAVQGDNDTLEQGSVAVKTGALKGIFDAVNEQNPDKLKKLTDISSIGFLILVLCCIFGFKFSGQASELAGKMAGGGMKPMAPSIATMGGSAALSGAKKLTQPTRKAIADKVEDAGDKLWNGLKGGVGSVKNAFRGGGKSQRKPAGNNYDGSNEEAMENATPTPTNNSGREERTAPRDRQRGGETKSEKAPVFGQTGSGSNGFKKEEPLAVSAEDRQAFEGEFENSGLGQAELAEKQKMQDDLKNGNEISPDRKIQAKAMAAAKESYVQSRAKGMNRLQADAEARRVFVATRAAERNQMTEMPVEQTELHEENGTAPGEKTAEPQNQQAESGETPQAAEGESDQVTPAAQQKPRKKRLGSSSHARSEVEKFRRRQEARRQNRDKFNPRR